MRKGQTTAVDLFYFAFAMVIAAAFMPIIIDTIGQNWSRASLLLKSVYVAMPGVILFGIFSEILTSREIEMIRRDKERRRRFQRT